MEIKIKQFSPQELEVLSKQIQSALDVIKARYGLSQLRVGTIRFNRFSFTAKIIGNLQNTETENYKQNEAKFFALRHGLPNDFLGSEFILEDSVFKITNIILSRPKYPITAQCNEDGRTFKFTVQRIKELLETAKVINVSYQDNDPISG